MSLYLDDLSETMLKGINYNGILIKRIMIYCNNCSQFSCVLKLHIDLTEKRIVAVAVNTETISVEENNEIHEVKNNYVSNNTEYIAHQKNGSSKKTILPLIPLDLKRPINILPRIKKLVTFY